MLKFVQFFAYKKVTPTKNDIAETLFKYQTVYFHVHSLRTLKRRLKIEFLLKLFKLQKQNCHIWQNLLNY